jgi:hypothetical protein
MTLGNWIQIRKIYRQQMLRGAAIMLGTPHAFVTISAHRCHQQYHFHSQYSLHPDEQSPAV